nr:hypothetical protein [Salmonella enterica]
MACSARNESALRPKNAIERQRNGVRAAYVHKAEHLEARTEMRLIKWQHSVIEQIGCCSWRFGDIQLVVSPPE